MSKKSKFLIGVLCLLLALPALGGGPLGKKPPKWSRKASVQLKRQVKASYLKARRSQEENPAINQWPGPAYEFVTGQHNWAGLHDWKDIYTHKRFFSSKEAAQYFLAEHNLQIIKWFPKLEKIRREIENHITQFVAEREVHDVEIGGEMKWLASQINPDTKYLMLAEIHEAVIADQIKELLRILHDRDSQRPIVLFTEFLPEGQKWTPNTDEKIVYADNLPLYQTAWNKDIPVVGLEIEPQYRNNGTVNERFQDGFSPEEGASLWETIEGVRLRNERWIKTLETYRAEYPDALFIIHAGTGHLEYSSPYSLGQYFAGPETLVVDVLPSMVVYTPDGEYTTLTGQFDFWTRGMFTRDRVLRFNSPHLAHLAGFDIRIRTLWLGHLGN